MNPLSRYAKGAITSPMSRPRSKVGIPRRVPPPYEAGREVRTQLVE